MDAEDGCGTSRKFGGLDAACCQLIFGYKISPINQKKLFDTEFGVVVNNLVKRIVYEDENGQIGLTKRKHPRLPRDGFGAELERLFQFVYTHSTKVVSSMEGKQPYEPWIAGFSEAVVDSVSLRAAGAMVVVDTVTKIADACLKRMDQEKVAGVQRKSEAALKRKAAHTAEIAKRHHFGACPVPKAEGTVAREAGYDSGDFDEKGELLPDSDCDEEICAWHQKRARYIKLMDAQGGRMDLKGRSPAQISGAKLVVNYDEDGYGGGVPYEAVALQLTAPCDAMWVRFGNGEQLLLTDEDDWKWR